MKRLRFIIVILFLLLCTIGLFWYQQQRTQSSWVSFDQAMKPQKQYEAQQAKHHPLWKLVKEQYDHHLITNMCYSKTPRIPKIIHRIWLGSPQPTEQQRFEKTWITHHPDWEYKLWTDKEVAELGLQNQAVYDTTSNWGEKSDIARYEILYRFGGLYIDTDFECIKPFDALHHCCDFYTGLGYFGKDLGIYNGLIASAPYHPILKVCIDNLHRPHGSGESFDEIMGRTGPYYFTRCVLSNLTKGGINVILPLTYLYPWPCDFREQNSPEEIKQWIKPETYAVHHWHVSWNGGKSS